MDVNFITNFFDAVKSFFINLWLDLFTPAINFYNHLPEWIVISIDVIIIILALLMLRWIILNKEELSYW